jgi:transglutaminase-like putative cysteine protease
LFPFASFERYTTLFMTAIAQSFVRRVRPRAGWAVALLALVAAGAPAVAAAESSLRLPAGVLWWAGALGLLVGMGLNPLALGPSPAGRGEPVLQALILASLLVIGAVFVLHAAQTLPPAGLVSQDASALAAWAAPVWRRELPGSLPALRSAAFLELSVARLATELRAAPDAGERGARLLVSVLGVSLTWCGALAFGYGLAHGRHLLAWAVPLLAALTLTAVLGGAGGTALALGIGALALACVAGAHSTRRDAWERSRTDYSDELGRDALSWGLGLVALVLTVAWLVPLWPGNPLARLFAQQELPSGLAAMQRGLETPRRDETARVGLSALPAVVLGETLEQGPPEQVALRIRTGEPLPPGSAPRYWRVRLLNIYSGSGWTSDARVGPQTVTPFGPELPAGLVGQEVEDLRRDRMLVAGLADVIGVDQPASAERLQDGSLAALTLAPTERYRVLSRPMEQAPLPPQDREPPDMRAYLGLPRGVPTRVKDLASIVSGSDPRIPALERALLLETYLRELPYSYEVQPLPRGGDAVDQFLFDMRQGYCTYYASAMAVMARSIGIPARVAVGYATGEYDAATGTYTIREAEAHAWPELYIGGRWTAFEPTPVRPLPARATNSQPQLEVVPDAAAEPQPDRVRGPLIWLAVIGLLVLASLGGWWLAQPRRERPAADQAQLALERFGVRAGVPWPAGATLHEYGALLAPHANGQADALRDLVLLLEIARYGGRALDPAERRQLEAAGERLQAGEVR